MIFTGERRIRVHTLALPIATTLPDLLHAADQQCIIGLLSKMGENLCLFNHLYVNNIKINKSASRRIPHTAWFPLPILLFV